MKKYLLLIMILTVSLCFGAERIPITINDFSNGLNTVSKGYTGRLGEGTTVHNFDLWEHPLSLTVRKGYDSVFAIPGIDSFLWNGIHAINFVDGTKKLAIVGDSLDVGYANVYVTTDGTIEFGAVDSFFLTVDTASTNKLITDNPIYIYVTYVMTTSSNGVGSATFTNTDSALIPSKVIDSMVSELNATGGTYLTASRIGDTLLIIEDSVNTSIILTLHDSATYSYPNLYSRMQILRQTGYLDDPSRIATRFPATGQLWWTQFKGVTYLGTGTGKAISYDGKIVNKFPMKAPGEPDIIPLTTSGNLDGTYRYAFKYGGFDSTYNDTQNVSVMSAITTAIVVDSQQVFITNFPLFFLDEVVADSAIYVEIWRTVGDVGRLDRSDSLWLVDSVLVDSTNYLTLTYTDTLSDSILRADSPETQLLMGGLIGSVTFDGTDDSLTGERYVQNVHAPGMPVIISADTADVAPGSSPAQNGIWSNGNGLTDVLKWEDAAGFAWMVVAVDTTLNSPSDSSISTILYQKFQTTVDYNGTCVNCGTDSVIQAGFNRSTTEKITLQMPNVNDDNVMLMLYRGVVIAMNFDTLQNYSPYGSDGYQITPFGEYVYSDSFFIKDYFLIGQFNPGDIVVDTLRYDSLQSREMYKRNAVPPIIKQMVTVDNQLLATDGQYLYESNPTADSVSFNIFNKSPINLDDGDEITTIIAKRGVVDLLKNKSKYRLTRDANGYWRDLQVSKNYGSVTAFSHAQAPEGDYFLSNDGVRLEDENIYREKNNIGSLMSGKLNNFDNMSLSDKKGCFSTYIDGKYILSFPAFDTSYVLNKIRMPNGELRYSWSTWDGVVMTGGDMYAVRSDNYIYPGDTLYFTKSGSNGIYRYGTSNKDNGIDIQYRWISPQLTQLFDGYKQVSRFYLEVESTDTVESSHYATFLDEKSNTVSALTLTLPKLDTSYIYMYEMPTADVHKSWKATLLKNVNVSGFASGGSYPRTIFKQLYIEMIRRGQLPMQ